MLVCVSFFVGPPINTLHQQTDVIMLHLLFVIFDLLNEPFSAVGDIITQIYPQNFVTLKIKSKIFPEYFFYAENNVCEKRESLCTFIFFLNFLGFFWFEKLAFVAFS